MEKHHGFFDENGDLDWDEFFSRMDATGNVEGLEEFLAQTPILGGALGDYVFVGE